MPAGPHADSSATPHGFRGSTERIVTGPSVLGIRSTLDVRTVRDRAEHLREVGVDVLVDSPGVGSNLQDHPEGLVQWVAARPMVTESTQWWEIGIFTTTEPGRT